MRVGSGTARDVGGAYDNVPPSIAIHSSERVYARELALLYI